MKHYAIIGFGGAGYHALQAIRSVDPEGTIDIFSEHPDPPYNPMLTTYYASNRLRKEGLFPFGTLEEIAVSFHADIHPDTDVSALLPDEMSIRLSDGSTRQFDRILIAAGARSFTPPIENDCPEACISMRTLDDARAFRDILDAGTARSAVVIGASMAGIKVVEALHNNGIPTTLIDMAPYIFPLAAYPDTAHRIEDHLRKKGVTLRFQAGLRAIRRGTNSTAVVECTDGSCFPADVVGLCIGTRARTELASSAGLLVNRGIVVNEHMETSHPGIYAAGDCCEGGNLQSGGTQIIGLWANAAWQGHTAGLRMADAEGSFQGNILHNITHFFDMDFIGFGDNRLKGETVTFENPEKGLWVEAVLREGMPVGINILGRYRISGILKNHFLNIIEKRDPRIPELQRGILLREGLSEDFIRTLEGGIHGNA